MDSSHIYTDMAQIFDDQDPEYQTSDNILNTTYTFNLMIGDLLSKST